VEAVGAVGDQAHDVVQAFGAAVVDAQAQGGEDAVAVFANGLGDLDEGVESGAAGLGASAVDQLAGLGGVEVAGARPAPEQELHRCGQAITG